MGDMAPRPRGGWQVGTHFSRIAKALAGGPPSESPDVYTVDRSAAPTFVVRHFPSAEAGRPCCRPVKVTRRVGESEVDTLARATHLCEQQHAAAVSRGTTDSVGGVGG